MARPSFAQLQDAFQKAILFDEDGVIDHLTDGAHTGRDALLDVYKTAYVGRLEEVLQTDHEYLFAYLGDDVFSDMARAYIKAHPSDQPNARWFSHKLPEFLKRYDRLAKYPQVAQLAQLERALNDAFDAEDTPVTTIDDISKFAPEDWAYLQFTPHTSVLRLDFSTNAADIWLALKKKEEPPAPGKETHRIIVWRNDTMPMMRKIEAEEAMMWDEAAKGVAFGALCELVAFNGEPDTAPARAAANLQGWLASGMISSASITKSTPADAM